MSSILLKFERDPFDGVIIDKDALPADPAEFGERLDASVAHWFTLGAADPATGEESNGKGAPRRVRGVWLTLPPTPGKAALLPAALERGFSIHHASPESGVVLLRWLPDSYATEGSSRFGAMSDPCVVPPYAHTYMGVGCVCLDDRGRLLAIREKWGHYRAWKLPGGHIDIGEDIEAAGVRELGEETGVRGTAISVVSFRTQHKFVFGQDDVYYGVLAVPASPSSGAAAGDDPARSGWSLPLEMQDSANGTGEIEEARWIPVRDFLAFDSSVRNDVARETIRAALLSAREGVAIVPENLPERRPGNGPVFFRPRSIETPASLSWTKEFDMVASFPTAEAVAATVPSREKRARA